LSQTEEIVKGCIAGRPEAQEALYKKYSGKLFGTSLRYTKDYSSAEDVMQEGFIKILNNISSFKGTGSLEGWMRRIIINTALEKYRKQFQLYSISDINENEESLKYNHILSEIAAKDLIKLIQDLPAAYKLVFNLYAIDGYSHKEIADMLSISEGTSKSNLSRARKLLQAKLADRFSIHEEGHRRTC
jgi:RNA polymerase sigma factor (sigma-70 family)